MSSLNDFDSLDSSDDEDFKQIADTGYCNVIEGSQKIADILGVSKVMIRRWATGNSKPPKTDEEREKVKKVIRKLLPR